MLFPVFPQERHLDEPGMAILFGGSLLLPFHQRSLQGTKPDPCRSQVINLVDLKKGIYLVAGIQYLLNLVGCNRIQTTAEGIQLHQFKIL